MRDYSTIDSPLGELVLLCSNNGLMGIYYEGPTAEAIKYNYRHGSSPQLEVAQQQLWQYFTGHRHDFQLVLDFPYADSFQAKVYRDLARSRYGEVATYETFAATMGYLDDYASVIKACYKNPLPIIVPDHRLTMLHQAGPYTGGERRKRLLQTHESGGSPWRTRWIG